MPAPELRAKSRDTEKLNHPSESGSRRSRRRGVVVEPTEPWVEAYERTIAQLNQLIADATALRDLSRSSRSANP
jgi:hypothetical protein